MTAIMEKANFHSDRKEANILRFVDYMSTPSRRNIATSKKQEVYPLKKREHIQAIANYFKKNNQHRDLLIFTLGINIGLRAGDLLSLRVGDVYNPDLSIRSVDDVTDTSDGINVCEEKTTKHRKFFLNKACVEALDWYKLVMNINLLSHDDFLFTSREGGHVEVDTFRKILKTAAKSCSIRQNVGTHTMRKTFGYWQFTLNQGNQRVLSMLQRLFGHSSQAITLRYIGISEEEDKQLYKNVSLSTV